MNIIVLNYWLINLKIRKPYIICICLHWFLLLRLTGQDAFYSQTNNHQLFINPAYSGNSPYPRFMLGYRNQWPGLGNAFVSYYISYDQYAPRLSSNFGFSLNRDIESNGTISRTSGEFMYSYPVELSNNTIVSLGFQMGLVQKKINTANLELSDQDPFNTSTVQEVIPNKSKMFPDFSAGAAFYFGEQYLLGFAVHHINTPQESGGTNYNYTTPMQISIQALAEYSFVKPFRSVNNIVLCPGIFAQMQQQSNFITWGSNIRYNGLITGLWFRNNMTFTLNTLIVQLGYTNGALSFIYSYDAWSPLIKQQNKFYGAHEVTFVNHFKYNDPKKKMRTLKCPKISR